MAVSWLTLGGRELAAVEFLYSLFTRSTNWTNSGLKWYDECEFC